MKLSQFQTDPDTPVEVDFGQGLKVTVRSTATPEYRALQQTLLKPLTKYLSVGMAIPPEKSDAITAALLSEVAVVKWEGLTNDDGDDTVDPPKPATEIPYSQAKAYEIFSNRAYAQFRDLVFEAANSPQTFRVAARDAIAKN